MWYVIIIKENSEVKTLSNYNIPHTTYYILLGPLWLNKKSRSNPVGKELPFIS